MNQVTNRVPYGLLSKEELAQFSREAKGRGMYELYEAKGGWSGSGHVIDFGKNMAYRLIIKDDEWYYYRMTEGGYSGIRTGIDLSSDIYGMDVLRPATLAEIQAAKPKVESLEDRVKAKYPDYEVVMLTVSESTGWLSYGFAKATHTTAQSDPRFQGYVYIHSENDWLVSNKPTKSSRNKFIQPLAVLFTKEK